MKKFLLFFTLAGLGTGFYFYKTDHEFRSKVDHLFDGSQGGSESEALADTDTIITDQKKTQKTTTGQQSRKDKTPKRLHAGRFAAQDAYAKNTPASYEKDIPTLAAYLAAGGNTEEEKVRVLFTWVATHVKYDDAGYNSGNYGECSAENVLKTKRSVCEGYSEIFKQLGIAMGLQVEKVHGYSKGYSYKPGSTFTETDHAWNAAKIDGKWRLFDATWASGYGVTKNNKLVSYSRFDPYWFDVNPKEFVFTHFPEEAKWLMTGTVLNLKQYETLPDLHTEFFKLGFNSEAVYKDATSGKIKKFVETYALDFPMKVVKMPYAGVLRKGLETKFVIQSDYAEEIVLIEDGNWIQFTKNGKEFSIAHTPKSNMIEIAVKINWFDKTYSTVAKYNLTEQTTSAM